MHYRSTLLLRQYEPSEVCAIDACCQSKSTVAGKVACLESEMTSPPVSTTQIACTWILRLILIYHQHHHHRNVNRRKTRRLPVLVIFQMPPRKTFLPMNLPAVVLQVWCSWGVQAHCRHSLPQLQCCPCWVAMPHIRPIPFPPSWHNPGNDGHDGP